MKKFETIYIIDDDEVYQFIVKRIITDCSEVKQIKGFVNGFDAIESLKAIIDTPNLIPEIIFLDLTMPVMDGWQFLEHYLLLRPRIGKKVLIYVVSSSVDPVDVERARNVEYVTDYVVKPITKNKFNELIKECA